VEAVEMLTRVGVAAWKIASGEMSNTPMFERIVGTKLPVILSSGMSSLSEIDMAVERVKGIDVPLTVLQCTSLYPCPAEKIGLNLIPFFRRRYGCAVGLSDHSGTIFPGLAAATLGIDLLEVHVTLSREMFGPDVPVSLTTTDLRQLVEGVRFIQQMNAHPLDKDTIVLETQPLRDLFTKSIVARIDLSAGSVLRLEDLTVKKPGTGIPASQLRAVIGRALRHAVKADQMLDESDLL
jgi:N-acetylneuraminate synthase